MILRYVAEALRRAQYERLDDGSFCVEVPELRGVVAAGPTLEACREQLGEVIEEWILVRVARGLDVPALGDLEVRVQQAG